MRLASDSSLRFAAICNDPTCLKRDALQWVVAWLGTRGFVILLVQQGASAPLLK
jgi:hypothetical protein